MIPFLFSLSTFLYDLARDQISPSETAYSPCRCRTRLFEVSEFLGNNYIVLVSSKATLNPVGGHPVLEPIFMWIVVC